MLETRHVFAAALLVLACAGDIGAREPPGTICESSALRTAVNQPDDLGESCGVLLDGEPRPVDADPMRCLGEHFRRCEPAYAHSMFGTEMMQTQDAIFIRRDTTGNCRIVAMENTLSALLSKRRQLAYKTCYQIMVDSTKRLWDLATDCGPEKAIETCPSLSGGWPCSTELGDEAALKCGAPDPLPPHDINTDDILTVPSAYALEPGYLLEWQALQEITDESIHQ